ncbi:MAG: heavy-metal-associated domain-containing protein [Fusobacteriaceae bacterium]
MKKKIFIEGMSCMNCVKHVKVALEEISGISSVEVDLAHKFAIVEGDVQDSVIIDVLKEEEYEVTGIENL